MPTPEPDATPQELGPIRRLGEVGVHDFCRDLADHVSQLIGLPATDLIYRENPWYRCSCRQAWFFTFVLTDRRERPDADVPVRDGERDPLIVVVHRVSIVGYQVPDPPDYSSQTRFAITLDDVPIDFKRRPIDALSQQIALAVWTGHMDLHPDHEHLQDRRRTRK